MADRPQPPQASAVRSHADLERFRALLDASEDGIVFLELPGGTLTDTNVAARSFLGGEAVAVRGALVAELVPAAARPQIEAALRQLDRGASLPFTVEVDAPDGPRFLELSFRSHGSFEGRAFAVLVIRDETERVRAEAALKESEERFRTAFQTSFDSMGISRVADGVFIAVNEGFTRITGYTEAEALGRSSLDLHLWDDPADRARLVEGLRRDGFVRDLEATFRRNDGQPQPGSMSARLLRVRGQEYLLSTMRDLTAWRRTEEERDRLRAALHHASKMQAVGQLAGGIAHDFNNLLTVILAGAEALRADVDAASPPAPDVVEEIAAAGERARDLTRQLLTFARRQVVAPVPLDLNAAVRASEKLLRRVLGEDVELAVELAPDLWTVRCDPGQIEQVVLNLAVNARDAMPGGGRLTLATANADVDARLAAARPSMRPGQYACLAIRDTGQGMSPDVKEHLFEPFFTTKEVGKGTGLGLATVYGIVEQHGGCIVVESEPGRGAVFEIYLPRVDDPPAGVGPVRGDAAPRGSETLLVVEDDPQVRAVTVRALRAGGYRVLVARSAREALALAPPPGARLDLLVTDVVMPGGDGRAVADGLRRERPDLRVLYVSGHADEIIATRGVLDPGVELLPKPFTASALLARVRAILDAPRGGAAR